jgi:hypothetical protein
MENVVIASKPKPPVDPTKMQRPNEGTVLNSEYGGTRDGKSDKCKSYCRYYRTRPAHLFGVICTVCVDRELCSANMAGVGPQLPKTGVLEKMLGNYIPAGPTVHTHASGLDDER